MKINTYKVYILLFILLLINLIIFKYIRSFKPHWTDYDSRFYHAIYTIIFIIIIMMVYYFINKIFRK